MQDREPIIILIVAFVVAIFATFGVAYEHPNNNPEQEITITEIINEFNN